MQSKGSAIRRRRQALGLNLSEVARRVRVSDSHLSYVERSKRGMTPAVAKRLARVLDASITELFVLDGEEVQS